MKVTCETCPFGSQDLRLSAVNFECHHEDGPATLNPPDWWCSCHPLAPGQRDKLAATAMLGLLADESAGEGARYPIAGLAERAYEIADAMMAKREKGNP